ncbi:MAG: membrane protein insertion efficiency factor YidD [Clostridia bacterium]|nr:membrane protein insertion efficiency factor YidD [Clostridia bacterium]
MKNPFAFLVSLPIRFYRRFISPLKPPTCRFEPTCSKYALEALAEWGVICGLCLTVWRVLRCNPFCKGGYDPVPENKLKTKIMNKIKKKKTDNEITD